MKPTSNEDVSHHFEVGKEEDASGNVKNSESPDKTFDINKTVKRLRLYVQMIIFYPITNIYELFTVIIKRMCIKIILCN